MHVARTLTPELRKQGQADLLSVWGQLHLWSPTPYWERGESCAQAWRCPWRPEALALPRDGASVLGNQFSFFSRLVQLLSHWAISPALNIILNLVTSAYKKPTLMVGHMSNGVPLLYIPKSPTISWYWLQIKEERGTEVMKATVCGKAWDLKAEAFRWAGMDCITRQQGWWMISPDKQKAEVQGP